MIKGEIKLWQAVVAKAMSDALNPRLYRTRKEAFKWIYNGGPHFEFVCDLAGVSPSTVKKELLKRKNMMAKH
jgi:hypothetical protein